MNLTYRIGFWRLGIWALAAVGVVTSIGCQTGGGGEDFISDDPSASSYGTYGDEGLSGGTGDDGGDPAGEGGDEGEDNGDGDVEISEADIVQLEGDRLYALSSYSGLPVVDMQDPDHLRALGTWETDAEPFEMYVEDGQAFVMFNDYGFWEWDDDLDEWSYESSSRLVALDASNPQEIEVSGEFTVAGSAHERRAGRSTATATSAS